ncbi:MAG: Hpt domain-containing protein [Ramlibacter sp.]|nr:Hpt domain-containing protein [Ramlibacter sp.]
MKIDLAASPTLRLLNMLPPATREQMVVMYRAMLTVQVNELDAAIHDALAPGGTRAVDLAHKIAGSAGMMQDQMLCAAARAVEHALREDRPGDAVAAWPDVRRCVNETLALCWMTNDSGCAVDDK